MTLYALVRADQTLSSIGECKDSDYANVYVAQGLTKVVRPAEVTSPSGWIYKNNRFVSTAMTQVVTPASVEADLLAQVDAIREYYQMQYLTSGGAKKMIYNSKQDEYRDYAGLTSSVVNAIDAVTLKSRFPYAMMEASLAGETIATVMTRWAASITLALTEVHRYEAIAVTGKRRIKAAATIPAKQAAYNAINWGWRRT